MKNINEIKDGDITILRYRPCNKTYVKKENDDEILYTKEEWIQKQQQTISKTEIKERLETMKKMRERKLMKDANKQKQKPRNINTLKQQFETFKKTKEM